MSGTTAVQCIDVFKDYPIYKSDFQRLKGLVLPNYKPELFSALTQINLEIPQGEIMGIIGLNGSGKSTLSNIIAGITCPSRGKVKTSGEVSMLSVSAGIDSYLTGRENIRYKCILLDFPSSYINDIENDVIEFADIGIHIDQPVRTYSSGMRSRLGFAISVHMDPDILIIDEALSVGDNSFADKSLAKMQEITKKDKTIIFVSHAVTQMQGLCNRVLWLHKGKMLGIETPENIIMPYCGFARDFNVMTIEERNTFLPTLRPYQEKYL